jgi:hypothetical protein
MRILFLGTGVLLAALSLGCSSKPPAGPGVVTITQTTTSTTTSIPPTTTTTSTSTVAPLPDLALFTPTGSFCRTNSNGDLIVQVINQASGVAGPFVTRLGYMPAPGAPNSTAEVSAPGAVPGVLIDLTFPNTSACGRTTTVCTFTINVDAEGTVAETNEANNIAAGRCPPG